MKIQQQGKQDEHLWRLEHDHTCQCGQPATHSARNYSYIDKPVCDICGETASRYGYVVRPIQ